MYLNPLLRPKATKKLMPVVQKETKSIEKITQINMPLQQRNIEQLSYRQRRLGPTTAT